MKTFSFLTMASMLMVMIFVSCGTRTVEVEKIIEVEKEVEVVREIEVLATPEPVGSLRIGLMTIRTGAGASFGIPYDTGPQILASEVNEKLTSDPYLRYLPSDGCSVSIIKPDSRIVASDVAKSLKSSLPVQSSRTTSSPKFGSRDRKANV